MEEPPSDASMAVTSIILFALFFLMSGITAFFYFRARHKPPIRARLPFLNLIAALGVCLRVAMMPLFVSLPDILSPSHYRRGICILS